VTAWRVLIGSRSFGREFPEHLALLRDGGCEVIPNGLGRAYRAAELTRALRGVDAIVTGTDELTADVIAGADTLRVIAKHGVGLDSIDLDAARAKGIVVVSTPDAVTDSVADLTLALLLALARKLPRADADVRGGGWTRLTGIELRGRVLGLVGIGRIGRGVAARAACVGMELLACDPYADPAAVDIELVPLDRLLETADVVSLHAGLPAGSPPLIGRRELALMRPTALLVNTARGALVDEAALAEALRAGRLGGAALDVFASEPPRDSPLVTLENVVLSPHLGAQTRDALRRMGEQTANNCLAALRRKAVPA
jgi:D-3-phosphoglycerate dehydrogenase